MRCSCLTNLICCGEKSVRTERPNSIYLDENNKLLKQSDFEYPAPLVLTPSEASESGICSNSEFQFPSPPKKAVEVPVRAPIARSEPALAPVQLSVQDELQRKLSDRLNKIHRIEAGEEEAFEKEQISNDNTPKPAIDNTPETAPELASSPDLPEKHCSNNVTPAVDKTEDTPFDGESSDNGLDDVFTKSSLSLKMEDTSPLSKYNSYDATNHEKNQGLFQVAPFVH